MGRVVLLGLLLVAILSCRSPYREQIEAPVRTEAWQPGEDWRREPIEVGADKKEGVVVDLPSVLERAGAESLTVKLARARAEVAAADEEELISRFLPRLHPRAAVRRIDGLVQGTQGEFVDVGKQNFFFGGVAELDVDVVGTLHALDAARARTRAASETLKGAGHEALREAARGYYDLVEAHARVEIAMRFRDYARDLVAFTADRERAGVGARADTLRAEALLERAKGHVAETEGLVARASAHLAEVLLLPEDTLLVPSASLAVVQLVDPETPFEALLERARKARPDLAAARSLVEARAADKDRAEDAWLAPHLKLGVAAGAFGINPGNLRDQEDYYAAVEWTWGPGLVAREKAATSRLDAARIALLQRERKAAREILDARARIRAGERAFAAAGVELAKTGEALRLARSRFEAGHGPIMDVLDLERDLAATAQRRVVALIDLNRAHYDLFHAVGASSREF